VCVVLSGCQTFQASLKSEHKDTTNLSEFYVCLVEFAHKTFLENGNVTADSVEQRRSRKYV
jgi:hypothetical protein